MTSRHCDCRNAPQTTLLAGGFLNLNQDPIAARLEASG
jgi:hypothetical protein